MGDNAWRLFGIVSWGPQNCQGPRTYSLVHRAVPWIESDSRIDITPCGDAAGAWSPTALRGNFPTALARAAGSWSTFCRFSTTTGAPGSTSGPAYVPVGPQVLLVSPRGNASLSEGVQAPVEVELSDKTGATVSAGLDGEPLAPLSTAASAEYSDIASGGCRCA